MPFTKKDALRQFENLQSRTGIKKVVSEIRKLDDVGRTIMIRAISEEMTQAKKERTMALLISETQATDQKIRLLLQDAMTSSYVEGVNLAHRQLRQIRFKPVAGMPNLRNISVAVIETSPDMKPHINAVNNLLSDAYLDFGNTMSGYNRGAERILNDTLKRQIRSDIAVGRLQGTSVSEIKNIVKQEFADKGFTVLIDRGGRKWTLDHYSEMVARTHIIKANNEAVINRAADFGVDVVEIIEPDPCTICQRYDGKIYSLSGKSDNYSKLVEQPPYHPNCRGSLLLRPDLQ